MSRAVKVDEKVYAQLERLRVGRQTFSDVIRDLLDSRLRVLEMMNALEGMIKFREYQREELDAMTVARAERADLQARTF